MNKNIADPVASFPRMTDFITKERND